MDPSLKLYIKCSLTSLKNNISERTLVKFVKYATNAISYHFGYVNKFTKDPARDTRSAR